MWYFCATYYINEFFNVSDSSCTHGVVVSQSYISLFVLTNLEIGLVYCIAALIYISTQNYIVEFKTHGQQRELKKLLLRILYLACTAVHSIFYHCISLKNNVYCSFSVPIAQTLPTCFSIVPFPSMRRTHSEFESIDKHSSKWQKLTMDYSCVTVNAFSFCILHSMC